MKKLITNLLIGMAILLGVSIQPAIAADETPTSAYCVVPNTIHNGDPLDAAPVMANYNYNASEAEYGDWFGNDGVLYSPTFSFSSSSLNYTIPSNVYVLNGCRVYGATTTQTATASATNYVWLDPYGVWRYTTTNSAPTPNSVLEYTIVANGTGITSVTNPTYALPNFLNGFYTTKVYGPSSSALIFQDGSGLLGFQFYNNAGTQMNLRLNDDMSGSLSNGTISWTTTGALSAPNITLSGNAVATNFNTASNSGYISIGPTNTNGSTSLQQSASTVSGIAGTSLALNDIGLGNRVTFDTSGNEGLLGSLYIGSAIYASSNVTIPTVNANTLKAQSGNNLGLNSNATSVGGAVTVNYNMGTNNAGGLQIFDGTTTNFIGLKYASGGGQIYDGKTGTTLFSDDGTASYLRSPSLSGAVYFGNSSSATAYGQINANGYQPGSSTYGSTNTTVNGNIVGIPANSRPLISDNGANASVVGSGYFAAFGGVNASSDILAYPCLANATHPCVLISGGDVLQGITANAFEVGISGVSGLFGLDANGDGLFKSGVYATTGTFSGNLSASNGTFSGPLILTSTGGSGAGSLWIAGCSVANCGGAATQLGFNAPTSGGYIFNINGVQTSWIQSDGTYKVGPSNTFGPTNANVSGTLSAGTLTSGGFNASAALCTDASKNISTACSGIFTAASTNNVWSGTNTYDNYVYVNAQGTATSSTIYPSYSLIFQNSLWNGSAPYQDQWALQESTGNSLNLYYNASPKMAFGYNGNFTTGIGLTANVDSFDTENSDGTYSFAIRDANSNTGYIDALNGNSFRTNSLPSPSAPNGITQAAGGTLAATTYYIKETYVNAYGQTMASSETSFAASANNVITVPSPTKYASATSWNVAVSTSTGTETIQNASPIAIGTNWTEPTTGLIAGTALPTSNTTNGCYLDNTASLCPTYLQVMAGADGQSIRMDGRSSDNFSQIGGVTNNGATLLDLIQNVGTGAIAFATSNAGTGLSTALTLNTDQSATFTKGATFGGAIDFTGSTAGGAGVTNIYSDSNGGNLLLNTPTNKSVYIQTNNISDMLLGANGIIGYLNVFGSGGSNSLALAASTSTGSIYLQTGCQIANGQADYFGSDGTLNVKTCNGSSSTLIAGGSTSSFGAGLSASGNISAIGGYLYSQNTTGNTKVLLSADVGGQNYLESGNSAFTGNATMNLTGYNATLGSTLNLNFATTHVVSNLSVDGLITDTQNSSGADWMHLGATNCNGGSTTFSYSTTAAIDGIDPTAWGNYCGTKWISMMDLNGNFAVAGNSWANNFDMPSANGAGMYWGSGIQFSDDGSGSHGVNAAIASGSTLGWRFFVGSPAGTTEMAQIDNTGAYHYQDQVDHLSNAGDGDLVFGPGNWGGNPNTDYGISTNGTNSQVFQFSTAGSPHMSIATDGGIDVGGNTDPGQGNLVLQNIESGNWGLELQDNTTTTTAPHKWLRANGGNGDLEFINNAYNSVIAYLTDGGNFYANAVVETSTRKTKKDIAPLPKLDWVDLLRKNDWAQFHRKHGDNLLHIGLIADDSNPLLTLNHTGFDTTAMATADAQAILQQQTQIDTLENQVHLLNARVATLEMQKNEIHAKHSVWWYLFHPWVAMGN